MQIAAQAPSRVEEFEAMTVSGLSTYLKRQLARHVVAAVRQADAFLALVQQGAMQLGDFQLDTTDMFMVGRWAAGRLGGWVGGWWVGRAHKKVP